MHNEIKSLKQTLKEALKGMDDNDDKTIKRVAAAKSAALMASAWMRVGKVGPYPHGINKKNKGKSQYGANQCYTTERPFITYTALSNVKIVNGTDRFQQLVEFDNKMDVAWSEDKTYREAKRQGNKPTLMSLNQPIV